ncbi:MAG: GNAT family N-acetyltransferase [Pseudomonadota bacterium]
MSAEPAEQPDVREMVAALDAFFFDVYPPDVCILTPIEALEADGVMFVARESGRAVGCGALFVRDDGLAEVKRVYVKPEARGQGLSKLLMDKIETEAKARGVEVLLLETGVNQPEAIRLYENRGYRQRSRFAPYNEDAYSLFYEKAL